MLREYQQEIEKLRAMVEKGGGGGDIVPNEELLEEERQKIREEYENEMKEMREKYASEQKSKVTITQINETLKHENKVSAAIYSVKLKQDFRFQSCRIVQSTCRLKSRN